MEPVLRFRIFAYITVAISGFSALVIFASQAPPFYGKGLIYIIIVYFLLRLFFCAFLLFLGMKSYSIFLTGFFLNKEN